VDHLGIRRRESFFPYIVRRKSNDPSLELFPLAETQSCQTQIQPLVCIPTHENLSVLPRTIKNMAAQRSDTVAPTTLLDSILETFQSMFINSTLFFITLGLLIILLRLFVRLATTNYRNTLTIDQDTLVVVGSIFLALSHLFLSLAYSSEDMKDIATAPSYSWAVCWSMAVLVGGCGVGA
jgi:hypothetical protein